MEQRGESGTDTTHALEALHGSERTVRGAILHDATREHRADARETFDLRLAGDVEVDRGRDRWRGVS